MREEKKPDVEASHRPFIPERPSELFIKTAQELVHAELEHSNHIILDKANLELLSRLPAGAGIILTPNHADETDPRLCLELSRLSGRLFVSMCNREAFDEIFGLAGFVLQRLGHFSVERGAHDTKAKEHAIKIVADAQQVVVIFPEGEIFYLNERVQPLHSGAVEIGMQALLKKRAEDPQFNAFIVPMAIKYHYPDRTEIDAILARRLTRMENRLLMPHSDAPMHDRIHAIQKRLIERRNRGGHNTESAQDKKDLAEEIVATEKSIISEIQQRHKDLYSYQKHIIDETWQLEAQLRTKIAEQNDAQTRKQMQRDLDALQEVAHLASWRPNYYDNSDSDDRLAEAVLKLERDVFRIRRPKQLAVREVYIRLGEPIELGAFAADYISDASKLRHKLTDHLHTRIQDLINQIVKQLQQ